MDRELRRSYVGIAVIVCMIICGTSPSHAENYVHHNWLANFLPPDRNEQSPQGSSPSGELVQLSGGTFYGVAYRGGVNGSGTVFSYTRGGSINAIYSFSATTSTSPEADPTNGDGAYPIAGLTLGADGYFYGTTSAGGPNGTGTIFRVSASGSLTTLYAFSAKLVDGPNADGALPYGKLVQGVDGSFVGTTRFGGTGAVGTIFRITSTGVFTVLYSFPPIDSNRSNATGACPTSGLILGTDGNFYGAAQEGGRNSSGSIFKLSPSGTFTLLYTFPDRALPNIDGVFPWKSLMQASDGNLYGTTQSGGEAGSGTIFRITPAGVFTRLYTFDQDWRTMTGIDSSVPAGPLLEGTDGTLYGVASSGGAVNSGTVFALSPSGLYSVLYTFGENGGVGPSGGLIKGQDGELYGLTVGSTSQNPELARAGTIYTVTPTSTRPMSITLTPPIVREGETFTVSWESPNGSVCSYNNENLDSSGSRMFDRAAGLSVFFFYCGTQLGTATEVAVEQVLPGLPVITLSISPTSITAGATATINWTSTYTDECSASGAWSGLQGVYGSVQRVVTAVGSHTYTLTCTGEGGTTTASATLTVTPAAPPTVSVNVNPTTSSVGATSPTLTWSSSGADACIASGAWGGNQTMSGSTQLSNLAAGTYTYTLNCSGIGGSITASATLQVNSAASGHTGGGGGGFSHWAVALLAGLAAIRALSEWTRHESDVARRRHRQRT